MKKKKIIQTLAIALAITSIGAISPLTDKQGGLFTQQEASAATTVTQNGMTFSIDEATNTAKLIGASGMAVLRVPETINGVPVKSIGYGTYSGIVVVEVPTSITSVESSAMLSTSGTLRLAIYEFSTSIGNNAFGMSPDYYYRGLRHSDVVDQDGLFFAYTNTAKNNLELVADTNNINTNISSIPTNVNGIPVTGIGYYVYYNKTNLTNVTIPSHITKLGYETFYKCTALQSVDAPGVVSTGGNVFSFDTALQWVNFSTNYSSYNSGDFYGCSGIRWVRMSSPALIALTQVRGDVYGMTGYNKVYLVDSDEATSLGAFLAKTGTNLGAVAPIPVQYGNTFSKWTKASTASTSVIGNIQDNITFVASYTAGTLTLPAPTVTMSTQTAINRDTTVTAKVDGLQAGLTYIYTLDGSTPTTSNGNLLVGDTINIAKQDTDSQKIVTVKVAATTKGVYSPIAESSVTFLAGVVNNDPTTVLDGITYSIHSNGTATVKSAVGKTGDVAIPYTVNGNKVTEIGQAAFKNCVGITSIDIPNTVTTVGAFAFQGCTELTSIDVPPSITVLNGGTFSGCTALSSVKLPDSITSMQTSEFTGCSSLDTIKANALMLNKLSLSEFNKVRFMDDDEATYFGGWYAKTGTSMVGKQLVPVKANYTFSKWTRYTPVSVSTLADIEDNVTFEAVYNNTPGTAGQGQIQKVELAPSKNPAGNRESGITVTVK